MRGTPATRASTPTPRLRSRWAAVPLRARLVGDPAGAADRRARACTGWRHAVRAAGRPRRARVDARAGRAARRPGRQAARRGAAGPVPRGRPPTTRCWSRRRRPAPTRRPTAARGSGANAGPAPGCPGGRRPRSQRTQGRAARSPSASTSAHRWRAVAYPPRRTTATSSLARCRWTACDRGGGRLRLLVVAAIGRGARGAAPCSAGWRSGARSRR